jgi:hypothetical protein
MDDFKKYMQQHAHQMDFDEPGEAVWKNITAKTKKPKPGSHVLLYLRIAAAACLIILAGFVFLLLPKKQQDVVTNKVPQHKEVTKPAQVIIQNREPILSNREADLVKQPYERPVTRRLSRKKTATVKKEQLVVPMHQQPDAFVLQNIESDFSQLINIQLNKVRSLPLYAEGPEYYSEFKKQFQQLEEDEKELKKTIQKEGLGNDNLENLINICQQKLNLLKLLQKNM